MKIGREQIDDRKKEDEKEEKKKHTPNISATAAAEY